MTKVQVEKLGIQKTLETIAEVETLLVDGVNLVKTLPFGWGTIQGVVKVVKDLGELMDAPEAWPELQDVDKEEAGQIGAAAYGMVLNVAKAFLGFQKSAA